MRFAGVFQVEIEPRSAPGHRATSLTRVIDSDPVPRPVQSPTIATDGQLPMCSPLGCAVGGVAVMAQRLQMTDGTRSTSLARQNVVRRSPATPTPPPSLSQPRKLLHGKTLEAILTELVVHYGRDSLAQRIALGCFSNELSIGPA